MGGVKAGSTPTFKAITPKGGPPKAEVTAKITEPGFGDFREDASCNIKPQSLIGEYYVDCQPGSPSKPRLKPGGTVPVSQTSSTIPQDLVNNILRRPYKERLRLVINELGTGPGGPARGPGRGAAPRPPGPARDQRHAAHPGQPEPHDRELHPRLRHGGLGAGGAQAGGHALDRRGGRHGGDHRHAPQRAGLHVQQAARLPGRARPDDAAPGPAHRRADPAAGRRPARGAQPGHLPDPPRAVRPGLAAGDPVAGQRLREGHAGVQARQRRGGRAQAPGRAGRAHRQAAGPVPGLAGRPPPRHRQRPARQGGGAAGRRRVQPRPGQQRRLHRPGVALDLLLLAEPVAERVRRHRPRAAPGHHGQRLQPAGEPHAAEQPRAEGQVRQVQRLARAQPAGQHHARLHPHRQRAGQRQEQEGQDSTPAPSPPPRSASAAPPASPTPARCPASATSPSRRSRCPRPCRSWSTA